MSGYTRPKWCSSRHPSREGVVCERRNGHDESHRAEVGPPLPVTTTGPDGEPVVIVRAQVESW